MDDARLALAELAARLSAARGEAALARLLGLLRGDGRRGAAALAERCERALEAERGERRRIARLFSLRRRLRREGVALVAGVDEVGMGPMAGPVVAAAVILGPRVRLPGLDDSKRIDRTTRERLAGEIRAQAMAVAVAELSSQDVDRLNIYRAGLEAMRRAVLALGLQPDHVLVDARTIPGLPSPQTRIVGGDHRDGSIAAASIVAKVHRDARMCELDAEYPGYGFARHKGYTTRDHLRALRKLGPSPIHRRSFSPVAQQELF
jgi:ribonuclease HII